MVFTTIQKFMPEKGEAMPELSARANIVVIADEAHRSQYGAAELPSLDEEFEEITEGEEQTSKEKLKTKWAALEALVGDPKRIALVAADLVAHFEKRREAMDRCRHPPVGEQSHHHRWPGDRCVHRRRSAQARHLDPQ